MFPGNGYFFKKYSSRWDKLGDSLRKHTKKNVSFRWDQNTHKISMPSSKNWQILWWSDTTILPSHLYFLKGLGAVLLQNGQPINLEIKACNYSRSPVSPLNYKHLSCFLWQNFHIETDQKLLENILVYKLTEAILGLQQLSMRKF